MSSPAIFLDRDDTLIGDPGYINDPALVHLLDDVGPALGRLAQAGFKLVVVTNQSGIARGYLDEPMLERIHEELRRQLADWGVKLDAIYYCPYLADAEIERYRRESDWRKPMPGMILAAAADLDIDLSRSWMIGDGDRDIQAGKAAGCRTILVRRGRKEASQTTQSPQTSQVRPDFAATGMAEAADIILDQSNLIQVPHIT